MNGGKNRKKVLRAFFNADDCPVTFKIGLKVEK